LLRLLRPILNKPAGESLDRLPAGASARVLNLGGERLFRRRLMELGLLPGTQLQVVRVAPLNGLIEVEARGSLLSLRLADAAAVEVAR
jgi:Fe2+ transport system protein FeoA